MCSLSQPKMILLTSFVDSTFITLSLTTNAAAVVAVLLESLPMEPSLAGVVIAISCAIRTVILGAVCGLSSNNCYICISAFILKEWW